jgi:hypothetical protein
LAGRAVDLPFVERLAWLPLLACAACAAPQFGVEPRYGSFEIDGNVGANVGGASANNTLADIGIEGSDDVPALAADVQWGSPHLSVLLFQEADYSGTGTLSSDITQGGITITAGTAVDTDLKIGLNSGYLTFDLLPGAPELGIGLGVVGLDLNVQTESQLNGDSIAIDEMVPLPVLAGRAGVGFWRIDLSALVGYVSYSSGDDSIDFVDVDVNGRVRLLGEDRGSGWLAIGYRHVGLDTQFDQNGGTSAADLTLSGPYVGLRFQF